MNKQQIEETLNNAPVGMTTWDELNNSYHNAYMQTDSLPHALSDLRARLSQLNEIERLKSALKLARKHVNNSLIDLDSNGNNFVTVKSVIDEVLEGE